MKQTGVFVGVVSAACSFTPGTVPSGDGGRGVLDTPIDADVTAGWSTPVELTELAHPDGADDPSLTADLLEIYFGSDRTGSMGLAEDIWMAKRSSPTEPFGAPVAVVDLNTPSKETTPKITADGRAIFFTSDRSTGNEDIYVATRPSRTAAWGPPARIAELSTTDGDYAAFAQATLLRLVYCRGATVADEALYTSDRATTLDPWGTPARIVELDVAGVSECDPSEPNEFALYYATSYLSTDGRLDIYRASRSGPGVPYGSRTEISAVNVQGFNDRDPWVSADERTMVFSSDRNGVNDSLYITTR